MGRYGYRVNCYGNSDEEEDNDPRSLSTLVARPENAMRSTIQNSPDRRVCGHVLSQYRYDDEDENEGDNNNINNNSLWIQPISATNDQKRRRPISYWCWILGMALVAHLIHRHGPPAPPPLYDDSGNLVVLSWYGFVSQEIERFVLCVSSMSSAVLYVCHGCALSVKDDANQMVGNAQETFRDWRASQRVVCPLRLPVLSTESVAAANTAVTSLPSVHSLLSKVIVGQDRAVTVVSEALDVWDDSIEGGIDEKRRAPLRFLFAGSLAVGKLETAKQIAALVFQHCDSKEIRANKSSTDRNQGVLYLSGRDFSGEHSYNNAAATEKNQGYTTAKHDRTLTAATTLLQESLYRQIGRHIQKQKGEGAVVIIHSVDNMIPSLFAILSRDLASPRASLSYPPSSRQYNSVPLGSSASMLSQEQHHHQQGQHQVSVDCSNVIFIFTTNVGTKTVLRAMKRYGGIAHLSQNELDLPIQHEVDDNLFAPAAADATAAVDVALFASLSSSTLFTAVVPFAPLGPNELEQIWRNKLETFTLRRSGEQWKRFAISKEAAAAAVDTRHLDYVSIQSKPDASAPDNQVHTFYTFSTFGAKMLDHGSIMRRVKSQIKRCLFEPHPDLVAVLDYDAMSDMALFRRCPASSTGMGDQEDGSGNNREESNMPEGYSSCAEVCRFSLS